MSDCPEFILPEAEIPKILSGSCIGGCKATSQGMKDGWNILAREADGKLVGVGWCCESCLKETKSEQKAA